MVKKIAAVLLAALLVLGAAGCAPEPDPSGISKAEYDKLVLDMDKFAVDDIINGDIYPKNRGEKISERKKDENTYIYVYKYKGETSGTATLTFEEYYHYSISLDNKPENEAAMELIEKQQEGLQ